MVVFIVYYPKLTQGRRAGGTRLLRAGRQKRQLAGHSTVPRPAAAQESQVADEVPGWVEPAAGVQGGAADDGLGGEPGVVLRLPAPGAARRGVRLERVVRGAELRRQDSGRHR